MEINRLESSEERSALRTLLLEYHEWMADRAGDVYDPEAELTEDFRSLDEGPESWAWVACSDVEPAGCVLLYGETATVAEFKRLYVRPNHRGEGIGRALIQTVIKHARAQEYETLGLTTPPWSQAAHALYESMGFERTPPYPETRLPKRHHEEAIFMQLDLTSTTDKATEA